MQRLKQHIEKWFGEGIEYKWVKYSKMEIETDDKPWCVCLFYETSLCDNWLWLDVEILSINDLCSVECSFLESLERTDNDNDIYSNVNFRDYEYDKKYIWLDYHRMQLSLLSDEEKILYLLNNTE